MKSIKKSMTVSAFALIAVLMTVIAYQAGGHTQEPATQPSSRSQPAAGRSTVVVTVNLAAVLEGLAQRSDAEAHMHAMSEKMKTDASAFEERLNGMRSQLQGLNEAREPGALPSPAEIELGEKLELELLNYQAWAQFANEKLDVEMALQLQDLYRTIRRAIADMARAEGYDLVLMDDSQGELTIDPESRQPREAQVRQQISSRNILFASSRLDITADLVARMNNQYRAAR